jgi:hypothetical protein
VTGIKRMAKIKKDGYKFSESAFGVYLAEKKDRDNKFGFIVTFFAILFGAPILFLIGRIGWNIIKWVFSIE